MGFETNPFNPDSPRRMMTLRDVEDSPEGKEEGLTVQLLRAWIYQGKGGKKLPTFRRPGEGTTVYVDLDQALRFRSRLRSVLGRGTKQPGGRCSVHLSPERAQGAHCLADLIAKRLGIPEITVTDAIWLAVQKALEDEQRKARAAGD